MNSPVPLAAGLDFAFGLTPADRDATLTCLREHVRGVLVAAFPATAFSLRDSRQLADSEEESPALRCWLYCSWTDGPSISQVQAVVSSATRVEVAAAIPGLSFAPTSLVHADDGCHSRSRAGWFALLADLPADLHGRFLSWARIEGWRDPVLLHHIILDAERLLWARSYPERALEASLCSPRQLRVEVTLDACSPRAWEVGRIAAALLSPDELSPYARACQSAFDGELTWFALEGLALALAALQP